MEIDDDKIDEAVLALLWLTLHDGDRAWKGFDWSALDRLHEKGLIANPASKAKSVALTEKGLALAEHWFRELFVRVFMIEVKIVRWVDDEPQPGIVECELVDRFGKAWHLLEKSAVVSADAIRESSYPQPGVIYCHVVDRGHDATGREIVEIDIEATVVAEAIEGGTRFQVFADQLRLAR